MKDRLYALLANAVLVLALTMGVLFILNIYNPLMGFTGSLYSRVLACSLYLGAAALGVLSLLRTR